MDISLDYINQVIARNDGRKGAGAGKAPASSDIDPKLQATTGAFRPQDIAALQEQKRYWTEAIEDKKQQQAQQQAYQQALAQHRQDMAQINQRERLQTAIKSGNRAQQYDRVQEYLANNENARKLWNLEHGMNTNQNAAAQRMRDAQALRGQMSGAELSAYEAAAEAYRQYGGLYAAGQTLKDLIQGSLTNAAGNLITTVQAAKQDWDERTEALESVYEQPRSANPLEAYGQITNNYRDALKRQEEQRAPENTYNETLSGLELARKGSEQVQRGGAALTGGGKMVYDLAGSIVSNAPAMALAAIPGVGPAASLGTLGAQAAGGKIDELSARGIGNREALGRGLVSGMIESATEVLPVSNWTKIIQQGGKSALRNIATQAFGEATEEGVSYIANYIANKMANDPEAEFSLQDLAYSAAMGAASGGIYGAAGTGINRAVNRVRSAGQNTAQQSAQNQPGGQGTAPKAGDSHQDAATMQQSTTNAARAQQDQLLSTAQQETGSSENSAAENPLTQLVPGGRQAQRAAETQQNTVNAVQTRQDGLNAVQGNPLNQLFPGETQAQQTATPSMQAAVAQVQQNTANAAQAQQEVVRTSAEQVQQWAEENESFSPEMRTLAAQNYQPGGNAALYETAVQNFYDAGRSGALSYEQAMDLNENRAAVLQQDDVLRRAWDLGRREAQAVQDAPGAGTVEGQVQYESGVEPGAVLDDTVLQAAARKLGVNIKVVQELTDDAGGKANGRWAAAMSEIALGENSSNAYQTLAHELTHYMGSYNAEGWARLRSSALAWYAQQGGQRTGEDMARYEAAYGDYAKGADEAARDVLSGVMSTEGGTRSFLAYLSTESGYTVQEQKTILQTLRDMLDTLLEKVRGLLRGGDATQTAARARQMAEQADQLEARRALINDYLYELDAARQNAEKTGLQSNANENAPAASRGEEYSINPEFDREIREWDAEGRNESKIFTLGTTGEALKSIGVRDRGIVMVSGKIRKILHDHPSMTLDMIRQIPAMLEHPALVLESQGGSMRPETKQNSRIVVVGTVTDAKGTPVLCALDLAPGSRQDMELGLQDFNKVSSAYAKDVNPKGFLEKSNVLYASPDTKITQAALSSFGFKLASSELNRLGSIGKITYDGGKVKMQGMPVRQMWEAEKQSSSAKVNDTAEQDQKNANTDGRKEYSRKGGQALELTAEQRRHRNAEAENRKLAQEKTRMADQIELLKQETRLSGGHLMDTKAVHEVAARVIKNANSRYDTVQLERELRRVYESMSRGKVNGVQEAMETLTDLARGILSQQRPGVNQAREVYKPLLDKVRTADWTVRKGSPLYQDLMDLYGDGPNGKSWGNVRRALFGRINVKLAEEGGASGRIDTLFDELAGEWPGIIDREAAPADNIQRVMEIYDEVRDGAAYDLETGMSEEEQAAYLAQDLYDAYLSMPRRQTYADRSAAQAEALTRQYRQEKAQALREQKAEYEQKLEEQRKWARDRMAELNDQYKAAKEAHDQKLIIKTHNKIVKARAQADEKLLRRRAALELQWAKKRERSAAAQERRRVQKSVQALHRWMTKPTEQQHVPVRMQQKVLNLLNSLNMNVGREGTATAMRWQEVMKDIQLMAQDALAADSGMAETDAYADFDPDLPAMIKELIDSTDTLNVAKMKSYQLKQLADILTSMQTSIRNANKMMSDARKAEVEEIGLRSAQDMDNERAKLLKTRKGWAKKAADSRIGDQLGGMLGLDMMDARRYFHTLGKTAEEKIYEPLRRGFDKRVWLLDSAQKAFAEIKGKTDIRRWTGEKAETQTFTVRTKPDTSGKTKEVKLKLTVGQRMELYNLSQRPQAREHLMEGGITLLDDKGKKASDRINLTPEKLAEITGSLTNEQIQMARKMSEYLSAQDGPAGWGNEVSRKLYGLDKFTERHYWPIKTDSNQNRTNDATDGGKPGFWAVKNSGFTKGLQKNANNSLLVGDAFNTWTDHVAEMATYNAWCIPLSDAMKWYNWKSGTDVSTKEQIERLYGSKGKNFFTTLMQDVNGMTARASSTSYEGLVGTVTKNWKIAKVSANWRVVIQQPTSYLRAMAVMNPKYLMQALAADVTKLRHGMKMAEEHCAIAKWKSWGYFETSIGQTMREVLTGQKGTMERLRDFGTKPAELGDKVTWGTLWNACEAEAKAKGLEAGTDKFNQYCADRLSEIVDKTQVVDSVLHRSQLMRNQNGAVKMATAFFAEPTKSYNMLAEALTNAAHGGKDAKWRLARVAATSVISILGTAAAASLVDALRVTQDEDRDKDYGERYLENLWQNFLSNVMPLNYIPLAKDILTLVDGYDVTRQDMELFGDLVDAVGAISKGLKGDISPYRLCYQIATAVSSLTGLPVSNVLRDTKSAYDMLTDMQDPLRLDRTLNRAPDDYSYIDLYNQVKAAGGNKDEFKALYQGETYSEMLGTPEAAAVDAWVQKLAQNSATTDADGNRKENAAVLPKHLDNEISYTDGDGVEHKVVLQGPDYLDYAKTVQQSTVNLLNEYMHGQGKTASTAEQAAYVKMAKEYAQELAREQVIPGYEIESWVQTVETLSGGRNVGGMIAARQIVSQTEGDKDENGKTITGSAEVKAVGRLQDELGYTEPEARTLYAQLKGRADDTYLQLYEDVKGDKEQEEELSALYVMTGEEARYADMLQDSGAKKLDEHLRALSETQGKEVLPDRVENSFKVGDTEVELDGKQYVAYAKKRTETAYNILNELIPYMGNYTQKEQAGFVLYVEKYAEELAKASVSDFELSNWVEEVQELAGGDNAALYNYIMAKELIAVAQGKKDANGNTIRGTKKAAALRNLKNAGYSDYMAQQMYKLFA